jgi:hypothetical protein
MKTSARDKSPNMPIDLVQRFARTPLQSTFHLRGSVICLKTNCPDLLTRMATMAAKSGQANSEPANMAQPDCFWRIVIETETDKELNPVASGSRHVSDNGISFVTIGRRSFLAYDAQLQRGISFLSERLVRDQTLFVELFLPGFLSLLPDEKRQL